MAPMAPMAPGETEGALAGQLWAGRATLVLLVLSALTLAFSVNIPWFSALQHFSDSSLSGGGTFPVVEYAPFFQLDPLRTQLSKVPYTLLEILLLPLYGLPLLGVAFAVLFTQPLGSRAWRITLVGCGAWLAILTLHALHYLILYAQGAVFAPQTEPGLTITYTNVVATWAFWLTLVALIIAWAGLISVWRLRPNTAPTMRPAASPATPRQRLVHMIVAVGMTLGALLWALGFVALPWTTLNCGVIPPISLNHFVHGSCQGLDAGDALAAAMLALNPGQSGIPNYINGSLTPLTALNQTLTDPFTLYMLLALGALVIAAYGWRKRITWSQGGLVIAWLLAATLVALVAAYGANILIATHYQVAFSASGQWRRSLGLYLTFAALALLWLATGAWLFTTTIAGGSFVTGRRSARHGAQSSETSLDDDTAPELATLD